MVIKKIDCEGNFGVMKAFSLKKLQILLYKKEIMWYNIGIRRE